METYEYQFKNLPLTPYICRHLILELFNERVEMRQTIVNEVTAAHLARGGKEANVADKPRMLKKALEKLKKEGLAKNPSYGYWLITNNDLKVSEVEVSDHNLTSQKTETSEAIKEEYDADFVFGEGSGTVYLYYLPTYEMNSSNLEKNTWACKIGKTDRDPLQRVLTQASTALPEKPKIAVIIKTNNSHVLEQSIHNILTYRNKKIETALGNEWFDTNPDEFLEIVQFITQSRYDYPAVR
ncbi:GIY-YIG nuclease family protein [Halobacillus amylolyticus]|uniref:GIY-YIG nuclease family protein n=1 Tax=Halobacillus amylolyticus TaxID=2932259 RepID=A0ABY4HG45_9BACI|nr:GIY-YIG nuclease family protein [Halobacillus amylolyticus]UOR13594.1 GIY-YIG nuclease family protein [Halobacillus amylolyticus]